MYLKCIWISTNIVKIQDSFSFSIPTIIKKLHLLFLALKETNQIKNETTFSFFFPDMQKFPLRMKDNDLLVTELYHDPSNDAITALSVYLTPKTSKYQWTLVLFNISTSSLIRYSLWEYCVFFLSLWRCEWELDRNSLWNQQWGSEGDCATPGDSRIRSSALSDVHSAQEPSDQNHAVWKTPGLRWGRMGLHSLYTLFTQRFTTYYYISFSHLSL